MVRKGVASSCSLNDDGRLLYVLRPEVDIL